MRRFDTSPEAHEFQMAAYRRMTLSQKSELIFEMSEAVRQIAREGIRMRHPDYSDEDVKRSLIVLLDELSRASPLICKRCSFESRRRLFGCGSGLHLEFILLLGSVERQIPVPILLPRNELKTGKGWVEQNQLQSPILLFLPSE